MADEQGISAAGVSRHWRKNGLMPPMVRRFKGSRSAVCGDARRHCGFEQVAPEHALVLCCDERRQVQSLDRTQLGLPLKKHAQRQ